MNQNGDIESLNNFMVTPLIPVTEGETIKVGGYTGGVTYVSYSLLCTYNESGNFLSHYGDDENSGFKELSFTIPQGVAYIRVGTRTDTQYGLYYSKSYVNCDVIGKLLELEYKQSIKPNFFEYFYSNEPAKLYGINGYYTSTGFTQASGWKVTMLEPVEVGDIIITNTDVTGTLNAKHVLFNADADSPTSQILETIVPTDSVFVITQDMWDRGVRYISISYHNVETHMIRKITHVDVIQMSINSNKVDSIISSIGGLQSTETNLELSVNNTKDDYYVAGKTVSGVVNAGEYRNLATCKSAEFNVSSFNKLKFNGPTFVDNMAYGYALGHYTNPSDTTTWVTDFAKTFDITGELSIKEYEIDLTAYHYSTIFRVTVEVPPFYSSSFWCKAIQGESLLDKIPEVINSLDSEEVEAALSAKQGKVLNDKINTIPEIDFEEYYVFNASLESKVALKQSITLQSNGDSLEFRVASAEIIDTDQYSFISCDDFTMPSVSINKNGYLGISANTGGTQGWLFLNDATIGNVIGKLVKISYEENKIKVYVDRTVKKTIDSQGIIIIKSFGKTGSYPYVTFTLNTFKINGDSYSIKNNSLNFDNSHVEYINRIVGTLTPEEIEDFTIINRKIEIKKLDASNFSITVPLKNGRSVLHHFTHQYKVQNLVYGNGEVKENVLCADVWYPDTTLITDSLGNVYNIQGNLNFIYLVKSNEIGFENETQHVGAGHGCEVMDYQKFYADGKEFTPSELTEILECTTFRVVLKAYDYANDETQEHASGFSAPKLTNEGNLILTAIHTYDALYTMDNTIAFQNNLIIKRNEVRFSQLHGAMLQGNYPDFSSVLVENDNFDMNNYSYTALSEGSCVVTPIGNSSDLSINTLQMAQTAIINASMCSVKQYMVNTADDNEYIKMVFYTSPARLKMYFEPCKTEWNGLNESKTFNINDKISVNVVRKIECY